MASPTEKTPTIIMALHGRYEETQAEYLAIELAERDVPDCKGADAATAVLANSLQRGLAASSEESDALRLAILFQVPTTMADAAVLQFHIVNALDIQMHCAGSVPEHERDALQLAIDTMFDFLCREGGQYLGELGQSFNVGALRASEQRCHRTGIVEG